MSSELAADGSSLHAAHLRDYGANVDHWLLNGFTDRVLDYARSALRAAARTPTTSGAPIGAAGVLELLARASQAELGRGGWVTRLARISDELERQAAIKEAMTEALYRGEPLFKGVPIKLVREHVATERARLHPGQERTQTAPTPSRGRSRSTISPRCSTSSLTEFSRYIATSPANLDAAALFVRP